MVDDRPSTTAMRVARRRAAHQILDDPRVFEDPLALRIIGEKAAGTLRSGGEPREQSRHSRRVRAFLAARSRYSEDQLASAVRNGVDQYVILGAGLDTSAYRSPFTDGRLRSFEVDHPPTQAWKREALASAGIAVPETLTFVPIDFETQTLGDSLRAAGFDTGRAAFFSWLGVLPYLHREPILAILAFIGSLPEGSAAVFDYGVPRPPLNLFQRAVYRYLGRRIAVPGEPFRTYFEPEEIQTVLCAAGFHRTDDLGPTEINARYFTGRPDGLHVGTSSRLVTAAV